MCALALALSLSLSGADRVDEARAQQPLCYSAAVQVQQHHWPVDGCPRLSGEWRWTGQPFAGKLLSGLETLSLADRSSQPCAFVTKWVLLLMPLICFLVLLLDSPEPGRGTEIPEAGNAAS